MNPNDPNYRHEPMQGPAGRPMPQGSAPYPMQQDPYGQRPPFRPIPQSSEAETAAYAAANSYTPYEEVPMDDGYESEQDPNWQSDGAYAEGAEAYGQPRRRPARRAKPHSGGMPLLIQQSLNDFRGVFGKLFSKEPERALQFDLSSLSWMLLLVVNLLLFALTRSSVVRRSMGVLKSAIEHDLTDVTMDLGRLSYLKPSTLFFSSLLGQLVFLVLMLCLGYLISYLVHSDSRPGLRFVKTLALCTLSQTLLLLPIWLFSFFAPHFALIFLLGSTFFFLHFYARAFAIAHPSPRTNQFWYFSLTFLLAVILYTWMPGLKLLFY